jgi:hypothetical protein
MIIITIAVGIDFVAEHFGGTLGQKARILGRGSRQTFRSLSGLVTRMMCEDLTMYRRILTRSGRAAIRPCTLTWRILTGMRF